MGSGATGRSSVIVCDCVSSSVKTERGAVLGGVSFLLTPSYCAADTDFLPFWCTQQRGYPGKMPGGQLKRRGPPLAEQSVIQHTPPPSLHPPSRPAADDFPSPSKRRKNSDQARGDAAEDSSSPPVRFTLTDTCSVLRAGIPSRAAAFLRPVFNSAPPVGPSAPSETCVLEPHSQERQPPLAGRDF